MKVTIKELKQGYMVYIIDEPSGRPIKAKPVNTLQEAEQTEKEFKKTVANMG